MRKAQARFVAGTRSSFRMSENQNLLDLVQLGIEIGFKYGCVNVMSIASGRHAVKNEVLKTVSTIKNSLKEIIGNCVYALTSDIWSDSQNHSSYLDVTMFYIVTGSSKLEHQILAFIGGPESL